VSSQYTLRRAEEADLEFLFDLLQVALGPYIAQTWGEFNEVEQRKLFYERTRVSDHQVVGVDGQPAGCVSTRDEETELRILRVFLLPEFQGKGLGTQIAMDLLASADLRGVPARLRVLKVNPARRLWERLGFQSTGETETHYEMRRGYTARMDSTEVVALEKELARTYEEISSYPPPIPACDEQFNYLLEKRDQLLRELARLKQN